MDSFLSEHRANERARRSRLQGINSVRNEDWRIWVAIRCVCVKEFCFLVYSDIGLLIKMHMIKIQNIHSINVLKLQNQKLIFSVSESCGNIRKRFVYSPKFHRLGVSDAMAFTLEIGEIINIRC